MSSTATDPLMAPSARAGSGTANTAPARFAPSGTVSPAAIGVPAGP